MSRMGALVLIPKTAKDVGRALKSAMAPFRRDKWDCWMVGGEWSGLLTGGYDPRKNPKNYETCELCDGTGIRTKPFAPFPGLPERLRVSRKVPCKCNGCAGTGRSLKDSHGWAHFPGDIQPANLVSPRVSRRLYSILTLGGEWHDCERARTNAHGFVRNRNFAKRVAAVLRESDDALAVVVEYHR